LCPLEGRIIATPFSGNYSEFAKAVLLEFITSPDKVYSRPQRGGYRGGSNS
jgi:hypothetical protein